MSEKTIILCGSGPSALRYWRRWHRPEYHTCCISSGIEVPGVTRPTYWVFADSESHFRPEHLNDPNIIKHIPENVEALDELPNLRRWPWRHDVTWPFHTLESGEHHGIVPSPDMWRSTVVAIQVMARLGYTRMIFVGCECRDVAGRFFGYERSLDSIQREVLTRKMRYTHRAIKDLYIESLSAGVKMIDASNGDLSDFMEARTVPEAMDPDRCGKWLVLGSGPGAREHYERAREQCGVVATCGTGIEIEPSPDYYWMTDTLSAILNGSAAIHARDQHGTQIITGVHTMERVPGLGPYVDHIVRYSTQHETEWTPGEYHNGRTSGCFLVQWAVNHGAREVHLVGMGGYRSSEGQITVDYDNGKRGVAEYEQVMRSYAPMMRSIVRQSPKVRFVFHGRPNYECEGTNVEIGVAA